MGIIEIIDQRKCILKKMWYILYWLLEEKKGISGKADEI